MGMAELDLNTAPLVEMRDIRVSFGGVHAVDDVSVDLRAGEVVGLVGGNGAGKSTLMRALSGAHPPNAGQILINRQPVVIANHAIMCGSPDANSRLRRTARSAPATSPR